MDVNNKPVKSQKEVLEDFIITYRNEQCLWNIKSKEYRDRQRKERGYAKLIQKLKAIEPAAGRDHVVKKINNIRSSYRKEKKKVEQSLRNGAEGDEIYQPKLWYYHLLRFLDDLEGDNEEYQEIYDKHLMVDTVFEDDIAEEKYETPSLQSPASNIQTSSRSESLKRKSQDCVVENLTTDILFPIEHHNKLPTGNKDDTFDIFGKLVACKLRTLPRQQRLLAEKIINETLFEAEMGLLTLSHKLVSSSHTQHHHPPYRHVLDQAQASPPPDEIYSEVRSHRSHHHSGQAESTNTVQCATHIEEYLPKMTYN